MLFAEQTRFLGKQLISSCKNCQTGPYGMHGKTSHHIYFISPTKNYEMIYNRNYGRLIFQPTIISVFPRSRPPSRYSRTPATTPTSPTTPTTTPQRTFYATTSTQLTVIQVNRTNIFLIIFGIITVLILVVISLIYICKKRSVRRRRVSSAVVTYHA